MRKIKKFEPLSVMRIAGICYAILGLVEGAFLSVMMLSLGAGMGTSGHAMPRFFNMLFGGFAVIFFPIFMGIVGAIGGGLGAVVYNVTARYVGGIEVEVE